MGKLIEGFWDCPYCGKKRIGGLQMSCPSCGASRGEDIKFYMDDPKNYISEEKAKTISENPDWLCSYCGAYNRDNEPVCKTCGATRTESEKNYFEVRKKKIEKENSDTNLNNSNTENLYKEHSYSEHENEKSTFDFDYVVEKPVKSNKVNFKKIAEYGLVGLLSVVLIVGLVFLLMPKTVTGTVEELNWNRSISVEEFVTVEESDWDLPSGGRVQYTQEEIRTYKQVIDHYETKTRTYTEQVLDHYETIITGYKDNGNGTFSEITSQQPVYRTETRTETYEEPVYRDEPVYDTKYYYEIDKWVHKKYIKTSGKDKNPQWGKYTYQDKEREGKKTEKYSIVLINDKNKSKTYTLKYNEWNTLNKGDNIKLKTYADGSAEILK